MSVENRYNKIGRFELLEKIGQGSYGKVYLTRDPVLARDVAIKVLHKKAGDKR